MLCGGIPAGSEKARAVYRSSLPLRPLLCSATLSLCMCVCVCWVGGAEDLLLVSMSADQFQSSQSQLPRHRLHRGINDLSVFPPLSFPVLVSGNAFCRTLN